MEEEEQELFFSSFEDPQDFFDWYNDAKAEYDAATTEGVTAQADPDVTSSETVSIEINGSIGEGGFLDDETDAATGTSSETDAWTTGNSDIAGETTSTEGSSTTAKDEPIKDCETTSATAEETTSKPEEMTTTPETTAPDDEVLTYEEYLGFTAEEQMAYFESFENPQDFFDWFNKAKSEYDAAHKGEDMGDGNINLGG